MGSSLIKKSIFSVLSRSDKALIKLDLPVPSSLRLYGNKHQRFAVDADASDASILK